MTMTKTAAMNAAIDAISISRMGRGWEVHHATLQGIYVSPATTYWAARAACTAKRTTHALIAMGYDADDAAYAGHDLDGSLADRMTAAIIKLEQY